MSLRRVSSRHAMCSHSCNDDLFSEIRMIVLCMVLLLVPTVSKSTAGSQFLANSGNNDSLFSTKIDISTGSYPWCTTTADFDGDGKIDIAASIYDENIVSVFRNIGSPGSISTGSFAGKSRLRPEAVQRE
jgi:hypothetical protein